MNRSVDSQKLIEAASYDMKVRSELEQAGLLDDGYNPKMRAIHEENAALLENFLDCCGWPVPSKYGADVHQAAWLIAIHAISKPHILKRSLQFVKKALHEGEQVAEQYAKLFDRIELYEGRKQFYGTQFAPSPTGWYAWDLEDPEHVDERRAMLGLSTFLEGKKACGADEGGFTTKEAEEKYEKYWKLFLKEVGWRS